MDFKYGRGKNFKIKQYEKNKRFASINFDSEIGGRFYNVDLLKIDLSSLEINVEEERRSITNGLFTDMIIPISREVSVSFKCLPASNAFFNIYYDNKRKHYRSYKRK
jgi:hypothetical protein